MKKLMVGNGPCSWGTLEFEEVKSECGPVPFGRMLDELKDAGYTGTELGDWGYMPTDAEALGKELRSRDLAMLAAFVPVAFKDASAHEAGAAEAVKIAKVIAAVGGEERPFLVLADANGTDPVRTKKAGRIEPQDGLNEAQWETYAKGVNLVSRAVFEQTGLRTAFHHHCAGFVETPTEIEALLTRTDAKTVGLVFDTGHFMYGAGPAGVDMIGFLDRFADRLWYVHCKDCEPNVAKRAREEQWDYFTALKHGVFCELGKGQVDFPALLRWLSKQGYDRHLLVEQDVLPGMGAPLESARRNREYLRSIESNFA